MNKTPIRIIDREFNLYAEIDSYDSLQIERDWSGIGNIELHINRHMQHAEELKRGRIVFPYNYLNKGYIIREREIELDENGKKSEVWKIHAESLKSWFTQRITEPAEGESNDSIKADTESVMRHYVKNNVINPVNEKRKIDSIILPENEFQGVEIDWSSRYKSLADELEKISLLTGFGWNIDIDYKNKKFVFKIIKGNDRTASQSDLPPAIFSPEFDTLGELSYSESELDYKNYAIVAGQGEGDNRRIVEFGDDDATGHDRYELFVDARDVEEEDKDENPIPVSKIEEKLRNRGKQKLSEHEQEHFFEGQSIMGTIKERLPTQEKGTLSSSKVENKRTVFLSPYQLIKEDVRKTARFEIDLSRLGCYKNSSFNWNGGGIIEYSVDNVVWYELKREGIDVDVGEVIRTLHIRYRLKTGEYIRNFEYLINGYKIVESISTAGLKYEYDYDLGDKVTLQNKKWGVTMDAPITKVKEIYEPGNVKIELTFGNDKPTLIDKIKRESRG